MVTNGNGNGTNGLSKKREDTCARIIKSLHESQGLLTLAARKAGVSYTTVKRYAAEFPSVHDAVQEAKESMLDFAEGKLYQKIRDGDTASIIFYLKTQGKGRGYIERQEVTGDLKVEVSGKDKLISILNRIATRSGEAEGTPKPD